MRATPRDASPWGGGVGAQTLDCWYNILPRHPDGSLPYRGLVPSLAKPGVPNIYGEKDTMELDQISKRAVRAMVMAFVERGAGRREVAVEYGTTLALR